MVSSGDLEADLREILERRNADKRIAALAAWRYPGTPSGNHSIFGRCRTTPQLSISDRCALRRLLSQAPQVVVEVEGILPFPSLIESYPSARKSTKMKRPGSMMRSNVRMQALSAPPQT